MHCTSLDRLKSQSTAIWSRTPNICGGNAVSDTIFRRLRRLNLQSGEDEVEGDVTTNLTSGAEWGQGRTSVLLQGSLPASGCGCGNETPGAILKPLSPLLRSRLRRNVSTPARSCEGYETTLVEVWRALSPIRIRWMSAPSVRTRLG